MNFLSKYICNWYQSIFYIWLIFGYFLNIKIIQTYINPYYLSIFTIIFFVIYEFILIMIHNEYLEFTLQFMKTITHILPYIILVKLGKTNTKYAIENLIIVTVLYLLFLQYIGKSLYQVYLVEPHPKTWYDLKQKCYQKNNYLPTCILTRFIN